MEPDGRLIPILIVDDDEEDSMLAREALEECRIANPVYVVRDGVQLLDFLCRRGCYADPAQSPTPGLILLDLEMPRMNGFEALKEIKSDPTLRRIPVVVLSTSRAAQDVALSYELGVNSFISKPVTFEGLVEAMRVLGRYWFEVVDLPAEENGGYDGRALLARSPGRG